MKNYNDFYTKGEYLYNNPTWDSEDSPWKAKQLFNIFKKNNIKDIKTISEVGCGSGEIMFNFSKNLNDETVKYFGFDISPQAIELANKLKEERNLNNFTYEIASIPNTSTDLMFCVDVFEHVQDDLTFLKNIKNKSKYFLFNIPLDLSVQSLFREHTILSQRKRVGHINYYTKSLALETLKDSGFEIVDFAYAEWFRFYKAESLTTFVINIFRKIFMKINPDLCVKIFGGSSLVVLAK